LIPRSDENIKVVPTAFSSAEKLALFNEVKERGGEGIVFKLVAAPYQEGKSKYALKWKFKAQATVVVVSTHKIKRSVQVAVNVDDDIRMVGNVTIPVNKDIPAVGQLVEVEYLNFNEGGSLFQPVYKAPRPDKDEADHLSTLKRKVVHADDDVDDPDQE
jgi:bifunctional non-homologous end joining protein LigD